MNKDEVVDAAVVDEVLYPFECLFREFGICYKIMRSTDEQTDEAIEEFRESAVRFGDLWRKSFSPNPRVPPKLHVLEVHCYEQLLDFGCIGIFSEDPVEVLHHKHRVTWGIVNHLREYQKREIYLYSRQAAMRAVDGEKRRAGEIKSDVVASRIRQFRPDVLKKREEKKALQLQDEVQQLAKEIEEVKMFVAKG